MFAACNLERKKGGVVARLGIDDRFLCKCLGYLMCAELEETLASKPSRLGLT